MGYTNCRLIGYEHLESFVGYLDKEAIQRKFHTAYYQEPFLKQLSEEMTAPWDHVEQHKVPPKKDHLHLHS